MADLLYGNTLVEEILLIISKVHKGEITPYVAEKNIRFCMDYYGINPHLHKGVSKMMQRLSGVDYFSKYELFISKLHWIIASLAAKAYDIDYAKAFIVEGLSNLSLSINKPSPKVALKKKTVTKEVVSNTIFEEIKEVLCSSNSDLGKQTELASIDLFSQTIDEKMKEYNENIV